MITIYHLYPDLMDLYGDYANVRVLSRALTTAGFENRVVCRSVEDALELSDAGFIYIGSGRERAQKRALAHLLANREAFEAAFLRNTPILLNGSAMELIGQSVTDKDGAVHPGLALAPFAAVEGGKRYVSDEIVTWEGRSLVGFINRSSCIRGVTKPLFSVAFGLGNDEGDSAEGYTDRCLFATHLIGPLLVKNPAFLQKMASLAAGGAALDPEQIAVPFAGEAYRNTLTELRKRMESGR